MHINDRKNIFQLKQEFQDFRRDLGFLAIAKDDPRLSKLYMKLLDMVDQKPDRLSNVFDVLQVELHQAINTAVVCADFGFGDEAMHQAQVNYNKAVTLYNKWKQFVDDATRAYPGTNIHDIMPLLR
ncbi:MAG: hypothetical protein WAW80_02930 [Candidatus Saccharimonadales bacterium]